MSSMEITTTPDNRSAISAPVDDVADDAAEGSDVQYGRVAARGVVGGWLVCSVLFFVIARLGLPHAGWCWWLGAAVGAAAWVGPFFGLVVANAAFQLRLEDAERQRRAMGRSAPTDASRPSSRPVTQPVDLAA
jgi:hypothetical protein